MENLFFFRIVGTDSVDGHLYAVNDRFGKADQRPDGGDTNTAGADETHLLGPDSLGKGGGTLAFCRRND